MVFILGPIDRPPALGGATLVLECTLLLIIPSRGVTPGTTGDSPTEYKDYYRDVSTGTTSHLVVKTRSERDKSVDYASFINESMIDMQFLN